MGPKCQEIRALLKRLPISDRGWVVVDHWEGDLSALGIAHTRDLRRLVYVTTWRQSQGRYSYICEVPGETSAPTDFVHGERKEDVDEVTLVDALMRHLG